MARNKGIASFSGNFEPQIAAPLDARNVVETINDLTSSSVWQAHDGERYLYNGMVVAVTNDSNPANNGIYYLKDAINYTNIDSWVKLGDGAISQYVDDTDNLVYNGYFVGGTAGWEMGLNQTTTVIDATTVPEITCKSGRVCKIEINDGNTGYISSALYIQSNKDYENIFVRFSIHCEGDIVSSTTKIVDDMDQVLFEFDNTGLYPVATCAIVNITTASSYIYIQFEQESGSAPSTLYVYDVSVVPVILSSSVYSNSQPCTAGAAGIPAGSTFNNMSFTDFMEAFFYPELFGTLTSPSHTFVSSVPHNTLKEIGETLTTIQFTSTFNRGSINPQYMSDSPYRSGPPNTYYYTGTGLPSSVPKTDLSDIQTINDYVVLSGTQSWTNYVAYDAGVQPKGSKGTPYDSPLPAGNTTTITTSIIGVYPWFGTSVAIDTLTKQPLALHTASYYQITMVAETDTEKQKAEFPTAFNSITGVQFYNTINGQWEWLGGSKSASLTYWTISDLQKNINGNMIDYKRYTHNGPKVGSRQLRFYTT